MIRIAFIVHGMQPGGIERSVTRIISGLDRNYFEPIVVCLDRSGPAAHWLEDNIPVIEIGKRPGNDLPAVGRLVSTLKSNRVDLVQSHNWGTLLETTMARKLARVPKHIHAERGTVLGVIDGGGWKYRLRAGVMRAALSTVDCVMSNSHAVAERVQNCCGYPTSRIAVIPNGVPGYSTEERREARRKVRLLLGIAEEATLIGSVGRLHEVKGFDVLIRAIAAVDAGKKAVHLVIVGEGEQRDQLQRVSEQVKISDRVHLVGHHDDVAPWLLAMDSYVNSSHSEGMSQSMVEAMSTGLPIVATDVGDARRMIRRPGFTCGEICPADDAAALTQSINTLLDNDLTLGKYSTAATDCHRQFYSESPFHRSMQTLYLETLGWAGLSRDSCGNPAGSIDDTAPKFSSMSNNVSSSIHAATSNRLIEKTGSDR